MLGAALMLIVFLAGAGWAVQRAHEESVRAARFARLQTTIYLLLAAAEVDPAGALAMPAAFPDPRLSLPGSGLYASIFNVARRETWRSPSTVGVEVPLPRQVGTGQWRYEVASAAGRDYLAVGTGVTWAGKAGSVPLVLSVFEDKAAFDREIAVFERTSWAWLGGAALLLLLSQTVLLRWGLAPLREATREIRAIEHGEQTTVEGRYVRDRAGSTTSLETIAHFAEDALLKAGRRAEAFDQFALLANQANSNLSTFRALAKKYPELAPDKLLGHLIASTPREPGKWFATAKTLKLFDRATQLAWASPCDPKTLTRAARDHLTKQPGFAMQAALAALHWMSMGHGYELTGPDAHEAHRLALEAAGTAQRTDQAQTTIEQVLAPDRPMSAWLRRSLGLPAAASKPTRA